jgi:Gas vesicle protein
MSAGYAGQPVGPSRINGSNRQVVSSSGTTNLADLLERVLDKGIVIAGDITVSLGQVELLSIKLRLIVASIDKAQEIGIDWWRSDPALSSHAKQMEMENEQLKTRLDRVEDRLRSLPAPHSASPEERDRGNSHSEAREPQNSAQN